MSLRFLDGNDLRARTLRRIVPGLAFELASLPVGFATSSPDAARRARDMVLAVEDDDGPCFAEAVELTTLDGESLRLELDSENEARFCRWRRETPARLVLCVALRRARGAEVELFAAEVEGRIADQPAGPRGAGWDRLFVPDGFARTLAELEDPDGGRVGTAAAAGAAAADPDPVGLRTIVYEDLARALGAIA